jgi:hypothetical protein
MHAQGAAEAHLLAKDAAGQPVEAGDLAAAPREHDLLAGQVLEARRIEPRAHFFEDFLDPGRMMPISSARVTVRRSWCQSPVSPEISMISRSSMPVAITPPKRS